MVNFSVVEGREPQTLEKNSVPTGRCGTSGVAGWLRALEAGQRSAWPGDRTF